jgi:hypothetical protein
MRRTIEFIVLLIFIGFFLCSFKGISAVEVSRLANQIAFLKDGEVWIVNRDGSRQQKITETSGKIERFLFSPKLNFIAYSKIIKSVEEPGLWEKGEAPMTTICSIVIVNTESQKIIKEIMPPESDWIYPAKWISDETLLFYASSGFDVWGFFEYDIQKKREREIDYAKGSQLLSTDFHKEKSLMLYVDEIGIGKSYAQQLHLVNLKSGDDMILTSGKSILESKLSYDTKYIAFIAVESIKGSFFDNLWIYNIEDGSQKKIYRGKAKPKSTGTSELSWSFDDSYLGMFFSPVASVIEVGDQDNLHEISGIDFHWIDNKNIILAQGNNTYLYNLDTRKKEIFLEDATKPTFLKK